MSDWNQQAAPNNNLTSATIASSNLVGKEALQTSQVKGKDSNDPMLEGKDGDDLTEHLLSRQPGM